MRVQDERRGEDEPPEADEINETGDAATRAEALVERRFGSARRQPKPCAGWGARPDAACRAGAATGACAARRGAVVDLRRTLRDAARNDGEVIRLSRLKRQPSAAQAPAADRRLRLDEGAHGGESAPRARARAGRAADRGLHLRHPAHPGDPADAAASAASRRSQRRPAIVSDFDGGTRIGDALQAFLAVPRFAGYARGAATLIVSDGLERGDPLALADAVAKLSRRAWRLSWLTPLARGKTFKPQTEALIAISRFVDDMVDGGSTPAIVDHVLALARRRAA